MSGIYLHIPFCKQACHYCNFHFSTSLKRRSEMLYALLKELELRVAYLNGEKVQTIYLGGGTPSLLTQEELSLLFEKIEELFEVESSAEVTLEANPDDLSLEHLSWLKDTPVNRLSIGIQSFVEEDLQFMNRAHKATEAKRCIENALKTGFDNLTIDLIYGTPTMNDEQWAENIQQVLHYGIPHISCYCLTVEPNTALDHFVKKGKAAPVDEEQAARQFEHLMQAMEQAGYEHYEISNFAKPGQYSRHNSNYWLGQRYLGIGPSAHSFDGSSRQWNIANNAKYIDFLQQAEQGIFPPEVFEKEVLAPAQRYNEYIMTSLRTIWGCRLEHLEKIGTAYKDHFLKHIQPYVEEEAVELRQSSYVLTRKGKLLADRIAMELFF